MSNRITSATLLIIVFLCASSALAVSNDANDYIAAGRADMFSQPMTLSGFRLAYQDFEVGLNDQSCTDCNSNKELLFLHALAKTAMLFIDNNDAPVDSFLELAQRFGITFLGDALDTLDVNVPLNSSGCYIIPTGAMQAVTAAVPLLVDKIDAIIAELDDINDPNFKIFFTPAETGLENDLEVDYAEVLILKGFALALKSHIETQQAYDLKISISGKIKTIVDSLFCGQEPGVDFYINSDLLNLYPNLLKVLPTQNYPAVNGAAILAQSGADLIASIDYYFEALNYILSEAGPQENHLIYIDPNDTAILDAFNEKLTALRDSLNNDTVATYHAETTKTYDIYDSTPTLIGQLILVYNFTGLGGEYGSLTFNDSAPDGTPSPWEIGWFSRNGSGIEVDVEYYSPTEWREGYFEGTMSSDENSITGATFEYWGSDWGTLSDLSGELVSTENSNVRVDLNPIFGNSERYPAPVSPRNLLPQFNSLNEPVAGTFGHGLGNDATLGGILPDMTQGDWTPGFPTISITAPDNRAAETVSGDPNTGTFRIRRVGNTDNARTVYFTRSGTATFGSTGDYTLSANGSALLVTSVAIPADQNHVDITVTPVDNFLAEPNETVILTLKANAAYNLSSTNSERTATVTILDNEP